MTKYEVTTTQNWVIETDDIQTVLENLEFSDFPVGLIGEAEFVDGVNTYGVIEDE